MTCVLSFTSSAIYGVATTPNDFATYLLAILIVNGLLYLAFYVIMKVLVLRTVLSIQASVILFSKITPVKLEGNGGLRVNALWVRALARDIPSAQRD